MAEQTYYEQAWANVVETGPNVPQDPASAGVPADPPMAPVVGGEVAEPLPDEAPEEELPAESEPALAT